MRQSTRILDYMYVNAVDVVTLDSYWMRDGFFEWIGMEFEFRTPPGEVSEPCTSPRISCSSQRQRQIDRSKTYILIKNKVLSMFICV